MTHTDWQPITINDLHPVLARASARGETSVRAVYLRDCPVCDTEGALKQDGVVATGLPIDQSYPDPVGTYVYQPRVGEVLKNHYMECRACGFEQAS